MSIYKNTFIFALVIVMGMFQKPVNAQIASTSDFIVAQPIAHSLVPFDVADTGISKSIEFGADLAWISEQNFRRNVLFMGADQVDIVRASFQPTHALNNGQLSSEQMADLNTRVNLIDDYLGSNIDLMLNSDHPSVDPWYFGQPDHWAQLIEVTSQEFEAAGHNVVSVAPFNEPDFEGTGQGSMQDFYDIVEILDDNPYFDDKRISGGNTLNCDAAAGWYTFLVNAGIDEGNTHQLAGMFVSYAGFYELVRSNDHHATNDELHNIMEAIVGYEYGMQTGIWWGHCDNARGELVRAFDGERLGYAEHRDNWTAAAVYRNPEGKIQAFAGTSERQAFETTFNFVSKDRVLYYDGHGPQKDFSVTMPGGTGYEQGQTNAERVVNITYGPDVQPEIEGLYVLVNRNSGLVMEVSGAIGDGANVQQGDYTSSTKQKWYVNPVAPEIGGDFSYYHFKLFADGSKYLDLSNFSLDNGGNVHIWSESDATVQQWYLEYVEDGWFHIRSRESSKCLEVYGASPNPGGNICQWEENGGHGQHWRFLPTDAEIEFVAPSAPTNLIATSQANSIRLNWTASPEADVAGYKIFRATTTAGPYYTIGRDVEYTSFVDNTVTPGINVYYYKVKAVDKSLNHSSYSNAVSANASGGSNLIAHYSFEASTIDSTINLFHSAAYDNVAFSTGQVGNAITLNGSSNFIQCPSEIANHEEISISTWVYWNGENEWQRIFDFGNSTTQYMYLTPKSGAGQLQFSIINGNASQNIFAPGLSTNEWKHIVITLGDSGIRMYVDGQLVAQNPVSNISPNDFKPVLNYIGRSQFSADPLFNGNIDEFRIFNYVLTEDEIEDLANETLGIHSGIVDHNIQVYPNPATDYINIDFKGNVRDVEVSVLDLFGKTILNSDLIDSNGQLNVSTLKQGVYLIIVSSESRMIHQQKIVIN